MQARAIFEFGPFQLNTAERLLLRNGEVVPLTPKVFDLLVTLVERHGHLLEREELLRAVWADSFVEEANLTVSVSTLRKALGEQADGRPYIETVPKRGYRFVADVRMVADESKGSVLHEQVSAPVTVEPEAATGEPREVKAEIADYADEPIRLQPNRRVRQRALLSGAAIIVILAGTAYWWQTIKGKQARPDPPIRSIAVLPFKQIEGGEKNELIGFGMADVLITRLGSLNRIAVRPTSAVFRYIDVQPEIAIVSRELNVDAVIEGNIQRIGERIRATVRLVRARNGELLWADTFDGRLADQFAVQDAIAQRVASALMLSPADEQKGWLTKHYTENTEAYLAYAQGRYYWNKRTIEGWQKAIQLFEQAISKDRNYALAHTGLADCWSLLANYCQMEPGVGFPKAKQAALQALQLDDTLAEAHTALAKVLHLYDWDWEAAEKEFKRAIELNPNYATAHQWYGEYLISMGRFDEAIEEMKRALDFDPASIAINVAQGFPYYYKREYDEAIAAYKRAGEFDPSFNVHNRLFFAYAQKRSPDEAVAEYLKLDIESPQVQEQVKRAYAASGMEGLWKWIASTPEEKVTGCSMYIQAQAYAAIGDREATFKWLEKCYAYRHHNLVDLKVDPFFDELRADPRYIDLLRRMRLES